MMKSKIGTKLNQIREEKNLSQNAFAEMLGMSPSAYARLERNETQADFPTLLRFSEILNVPIHEFIPELNAYHNYHQSGVGGGTVFGNQSINYYSSESDAVRRLTLENELLQEKITLLEQQLAVYQSLLTQKG